MKSLLVSLLMLATVLAGCSDGGTPDDCNDPDCTIAPPPETGKSHIVGVVVDQTVQPIVGATVKLVGTEMTKKTDDRGTFLFENLDPATYFIEASKPGYTTAQQSIETVAGKTAPSLMLRIESIPGAAPEFQVLSFEGFIECSGGFSTSLGPYAYSSVCSSPNLYSELVCNVTNDTAPEPVCLGQVNNDKFDETYVLERMPDFVQSELIWSGTQAAGGIMSLMYSVPCTTNGGFPCDYVWDAGTSPVKITGNRTVFEENGVGVGEDQDPLWVRVFPHAETETAPVGAGASIQQSYEVFTVLFYNFAPPEDYLYSVSGDPELPA